MRLSAGYAISKYFVSGGFSRLSQCSSKLYLLSEDDGKPAQRKSSSWQAKPRVGLSLANTFCFSSIRFMYARACSASASSLARSHVPDRSDHPAQVQKASTNSKLKRFKVICFLGLTTLTSHVWNVSDADFLQENSVEVIRRFDSKPFDRGHPPG